MLTLKKDPVLVTKICLVVIAGCLAFSVLGAAFGPRAQAQSAPSGEERIPGTLITAPEAGTMVRYAVDEGAPVKSGTVIAYININNTERPLASTSKGIVTFKAAPGAEFHTKDTLAEIEIAPISIGSFIGNIARTTGLFAFINGSGENGTPRIEKTPAGEDIKVFGWMEFIMVAVGFLIV